MAEIEHELRDYILENYFFNQESVLGNADSFMDLGVIDSTGVLELVSHLEERYAIEIDEVELVPENLDSIDNLTKFVQRKLAEQGDSSRVPREMAAPRNLGPTRSN